MFGKKAESIGAYLVRVRSMHGHDPARFVYVGTRGDIGSRLKDYYPDVPPIEEIRPLTQGEARGFGEYLYAAKETGIPVPIDTIGGVTAMQIETFREPRNRFLKGKAYLTKDLEYVKGLESGEPVQLRMELPFGESKG